MSYAPSRLFRGRFGIIASQRGWATNQTRLGMSSSWPRSFPRQSVHRPIPGLDYRRHGLLVCQARHFRGMGQFPHHHKRSLPYDKIKRLFSEWIIPSLDQVDAESYPRQAAVEAASRMIAKIPEMQAISSLEEETRKARRATRVEGSPSPHASA